MSSMLINSLSNKLYGTPMNQNFASGYAGNGQIDRNLAGQSYPGYKTGGKVKKTGLALVHKSEYILPASIKPTKAQKAAVAKLKRKN